MKIYVDELLNNCKECSLISSIDLYSYTDDFLYQVEKGEKNE